MTSTTVGFVGVGRMGAPMARRLMNAGVRVVAYDASPAALSGVEASGAVAASSPKAVADEAGLVLVSLPTPDILEKVVLGENGVSSGSKVKIVVDLSTSGPKAAARVAAGLADRSIDWVDSPVSGGVKGAEAGTLAVMVSCKEEVRATVEPILTNFGKTFFTGQEPGQAQVAKLANNILAAGVMVMTTEVMAMGMKARLNPEVLLDIIQAGSGRNSAAGDKFPRCVLPGTFDFGFAIGLSYKDVRLCVDEAEGLGVPMLAGGVVREVLAMINAKYGADADFTYIAKFMEELTGVEIRK